MIDENGIVEGGLNVEVAKPAELLSTLTNAAVKLEAMRFGRSNCSELRKCRAVGKQRIVMEYTQRGWAYRVAYWPLNYIINLTY